MMIIDKHKINSLIVLTQSTKEPIPLFRQILNISNLNLMYLSPWCVQMLRILGNHITHLDLSCNQLVYFPRALCSIKGIKWLNVSDNLLDFLPSPFYTILNNLDVFLSNGNPFRHIPRSALSSTKCLSQYLLGLFMTEQEEVSIFYFFFFNI
jgi:hypothetical protein